ncbi:MAG: type I 3-dehydroquinate dehydratase [Deltaproteobacteria bacterium]|nr:type I 3-dehydroquinate dehydratase [Deltaproteobacteria bacterium]
MNIGKVKLGNIPRIAAVILDGEDKKAVAQAKRDGADILELRIDCFKRKDAAYIQRTIKNASDKNLPTIATIRSMSEGGKAVVSEGERLKLFFNIMPFVDAVDVEFSSKKILKAVINKAHGLNKKVIVSYHNFKNTPEQKRLERIVKDCKRAGGDIVKVATLARSKKDIARLALTTASHNDIITIAMGKFGTLSRVFFPMLGSLLVYCSVTKSSAPGQIPLKDTKILLKVLKEV